MPDSKITALTALTSADPANDMFPIVDVSDTSMAASGTTKRISINNLLAASGTATLASATITGDLTVDTSTLKVDSANNRVGIGTASPAILFHATLPAATYGEVGRFYDGSGNGISFTANAGSGFNQITSTGAQPLIVNVNSSERYRLASDGVATWSNVGGVAGTAMTLNSTGLGVGVASPAFKLQVVGTSGLLVDFCGSGVAGLQTLVRLRTATGNSNGLLIQGNVSNDEMYINNFYNAALSFGTNNTERLRIDSSGNVGIGVTPSAWFSTWKVLQFGGGSHGGPSDRLFSLQNAIVNASGQYQYLSGSSTPASGYRQFNGAHDWYTAAAGTSPNQITDFSSPKMTLESTGSLVLGAAAVATTAGDGFLYIPGCAGTPTGTPTAKTGRVPLVVDTTNNKLYFYSGGAWVAAN